MRTENNVHSGGCIARATNFFQAGAGRTSRPSGWQAPLPPIKAVPVCTLQLHQGIQFSSACYMCAQGVRLSHQAKDERVWSCVFIAHRLLAFARPPRWDPMVFVGHSMA